MTSVPEQFTAESKAQVRAQFDFLSSFASQAFDSASRVVALNLATSRASVERSTRAAHTLIASRDPRDLLVLGGHAEEQMRSLFAYGRELMGIASSVQPFAARLPAPASQPESQPDSQPASQLASQPAAQPAEPLVVAEAQAEAVVDAPAPFAEPTPIATAAANGEPVAAVAPRPAAAPVPAQQAEVALPKVAPARRKGK